MGGTPVSGIGVSNPSGGRRPWSASDGCVDAEAVEGCVVEAGGELGGAACPAHARPAINTINGRMDIISGRPVRVPQHHSRRIFRRTPSHSERIGDSADQELPPVAVTMYSNRPSLVRIAAAASRVGNDPNCTRYVGM